MVDHRSHIFSSCIVSHKISSGPAFIFKILLLFFFSFVCILPTAPSIDFLCANHDYPTVLSLLDFCGLSFYPDPALNGVFVDPTDT